MSEIAEKYEQVVDEEAFLLERIRTCEACLSAVLEFTYRHVKEHHQLTIEDIVTAIFAISNDLRTELLHVQFEKAVLSGEMRHRDNR